MKSHRPERVGNVVRQVVSEAIASRLSDPRIEPLTSVTRVDVTPDLEHAKVHVSVMGDERAGRLTLAGLNSAAGHIRRMLGDQLSLRRTPGLSFHLDVSIKRAADTIRLIDEAMAELREASPDHETDGESEDGAEGEGRGVDA